MTTGTAFDAIGVPVAAITSDWEFFDETFAGADVRYGSTTDDLTRCLSDLTSQQLAASAAAMAEPAERHDWSVIADRLLTAVEALY